MSILRTFFAPLLLAAMPAVSLAQAPAPAPATANPVVEQLLKLQAPAAVQEARKRPADVKAALAELRTRFDNSIRSDRTSPEQRKVQFDVPALQQGLALGRIYADATKDDTPLRLFVARQNRIEGTQLLNERKYDAAMKKLNEAMAEAEKLDDVWLQIITETNIAYGYLELGQMSAALEACKKARVIADRSDVRSRALAVFNLASMQMHLQHYDEVIPLSLEAIELSKQVNNRLWEGNARLNLGVAYLQAKKIPEARAALVDARDVLLKTQDKLGTGRSYYNLALALAQGNAYAEAVAEMERALPIVRGVDIRHSHEIELQEGAYYNSIEETALRLLAEWNKRLGNADKSRQYAAELEALSAKRPHDADGHTHK